MPRSHRGICAIAALLAACSKEAPPAGPPPQVTVTIGWSGADAAAVETGVLEPLEEAVTAVPRVAHLHGLAEDGLATLDLELAPGADVDAAAAAVREALGGLTRRLPDDADPPVVRVDRGGTVHAIAWTHGASPLDAVQRVPGVRAVAACGVTEPVLRVHVDLARAAALGVGADHVIAALREARELPAGVVQAGATDAAIRVTATPRTAEDLGALPVRDGVRLADVAQLERAIDRDCVVVAGDRGGAMVLDLALDPTTDRAALRAALGDGVLVDGPVLRGELEVAPGTSRERVAHVAAAVLDAAGHPGAWASVQITERGATLTAVPAGDAAVLAATLEAAATRVPGVAPLVLTGPGLATRRQVVPDDDLARTPAATRLDLAIDRDRAAALGVSPRTIADVQAALADGGVRVAALEDAGERIDIRVHLRADGDGSIPRAVLLAGRDGLVPLDQLVTAREVRAPRAIRHEDRRRAVVRHVR